MVSSEENEKEGWHYLAVKRLSALLCRKTSNHDSDFYCTAALKYHQKKESTKTYALCNLRRHRVFG